MRILLTSVVLAATAGVVCAEQAGHTAEAAAQDQPLYHITELPAGKPRSELKVEPAMRKAVAEILPGLASEKFSEREAAQKKLRALGDDANAAIVEAMEKHKQSETASRLTAALEEIEDRECLNLPPISLSLENATGKELCEALTKVLGVVVANDYFDSRDSPRISVDVFKKPYWQAMQEIHQQRSLWPQHGGHGGRINLGYTSSDYYKRGCVSGPFIFSPAEFKYLRKVAFDGVEEANRGFWLKMRFEVDPRLMVLQHSEPIVTEFVDDLGNNLLEKPGSDEIREDWHRVFSGEANITLIRPEKAGKTARVKGHQKFMVAVGTTMIDIPDITAAEQVEIPLGPLTFVFDKALKQSTAIECTLKRTGVDRSGYVPREFAELTLTDADGKQLIYSAIAGGLRTGRGGARAPVSAKLVLPLRTKIVDVPFEFKDLPMP